MTLHGAESGGEDVGDFDGEGLTLRTIGIGAFEGQTATWTAHRPR